MIARVFGSVLDACRVARVDKDTLTEMVTSCDHAVCDYLIFASVPDIQCLTQLETAPLGSKSWYVEVLELLVLFSWAVAAWRCGAIRLRLDCGWRYSLSCYIRYAGPCLLVTLGFFCA